jgi:hypothetical protein
MMMNTTTSCPQSPPLHCIIKRKTNAPGAPIKKKRRDGLRRFTLPVDDDNMSDLEI